MLSKQDVALEQDSITCKLYDKKFEGAYAAISSVYVV
jgi:hypothetical protein